MWESAFVDISRKVALQQRKKGHKLMAANVPTTTQNNLSSTHIQKMSQNELEHKHNGELEPLISQRISSRLPELSKQLEHASEAREQNMQWDKLIRSDEALASTMAELQFQHHLTQLSSSGTTEKSIVSPQEIKLELEEKQDNQITSSQDIIRAALHYPFALCAEVVCTLLKAGKIDDAVMLIHNWQVPNLVHHDNLSKMHRLEHECNEESKQVCTIQSNQNVVISAHTCSRVVLEFVHVLKELRSLNDVITLRALTEILEAAYKEQYAQNGTYWQSVALVYQPSAQLRWRMRTLQHKLFAPLKHTEMEMLYFKAIETLCTLPTSGAHTINLQNNATSHNIRLVEKLTWLSRAIHVEQQLKSFNYYNNSNNNAHNTATNKNTFPLYKHHHNEINTSITLPYSLQRAFYTHIERDPNYHHELAMSVCPLLPHVCSSQFITSSGAELVCLSVSELKKLRSVYHTDLAHTTKTSLYSSQSNCYGRGNGSWLAHVHSWTDILHFMRHRSKPIREVTLKLHFIDQLLSTHVKRHQKGKHHKCNKNNKIVDVIGNGTQTAVCSNESINNGSSSSVDDVILKNEELKEFYKEIAQSITSELYSAQIALRRRMCWHLLCHPQRHFLLHKVLHLSLLDVFSIYALTFRTVQSTSRRFAKACLLTIKNLCMKQEYERAARIAWNHLTLECTLTAELLASHPHLANYVVVAMCRSIHLSVIHRDSSSRSAKLIEAPSTSLLVLSPWMGHRTLAFLRLLHKANLLTPMQCIPLCTCALNCGLHFQHINDLMDLVFDSQHSINNNSKQSDKNSSSNNELKCWTADMIRVCAAHHEVQQASWPLSIESSSSSSSYSYSSRIVYRTEWQRLMHSLYRFFPSRRKQCNESIALNRYTNRHRHEYDNDDDNGEFTTNVNYNKNNNYYSNPSHVNRQLAGKCKIVIDVPNRSRQQALWSLLYDKPTASRHHILKSLVLSLYLDEEVRNAFIMCDGWLPEPSPLTSSTTCTTSMTNTARTGAFSHKKSPSSSESLLSSSATISSPSMQALQQAHSLLNYETAASLASSCYSYHTYKTFIEGLRAKATQWRSTHTTSSRIAHEANSLSIRDETHNCAESCESATDNNRYYGSKYNNGANGANCANDRLHHLLISELDQLEISNDEIAESETDVETSLDDCVEEQNSVTQPWEELEPCCCQLEEQHHEEKNRNNCEFSTAHIVAKQMVTHVEDYYYEKLNQEISYQEQLIRFVDVKVKAVSSCTL